MVKELPAQAPLSEDQSEAAETNILRIAAWLVSASVVIGGLYIGQDVLLPLAISFLISFVLSPLVGWLSRHGLPRILSVTVVMLVLVAFLAALGMLMGSQIRTLSAELPTYQETIRNKISTLTESLKGPSFLDGALQTVQTVQSETGGAIAQPADMADVQKVEVVGGSTSPFETALAWLLPALAPLATAGIIFVFVFLALLDRGDLRDRLIRLFGGNLHRTTDALEEAGKRISKYLLMQLVVNVSYGIPMALGLWLIGVPGWLLWGTLAALMRFIPYVGPMLSAVFPLALAFAVDPGWEMVLWTIALIGFLELVSNNIIEPMLYGTSTGLSAISLIAAATFWTALWGPVGLILSTPLTVCLLVLGRNLPQLQLFDTLLGSTPVLDVPTRIYQRLLADDPQEAIEIVEAVIEDDNVSDFYHDYGIDVLRKVTDDYLNNARAEHRLRVANGMDVLLDDLREEYSPAPEMAQSLQAPARIACIGGKWEIDSMACEMLLHSMALHGLKGEQRREGVITSRYIDKLDLDGIDILCISYFSRDPSASARSFCRRLRQRWPGRKIVLALWNAPPELLEGDLISSLGADEVVTSIDEARLRLQRMLAPDAVLDLQQAEAPENDRQRVEALAATNVLSGEYREDLDALAKRAADVFNVKFAVISAIDTRNEFIIGQSIDLPGQKTRDGSDMITMPRSEAICDHVVSSGETLVVNDTKRDPRFSDHPAIELWNTRFYAGAPLETADGAVLGALCLLDLEPRKLDDEEINLLHTLAADVVALITGEDPIVREDDSKAKKASAVVGQMVPD